MTSHHIIGQLLLLGQRIWSNLVLFIVDLSLIWKKKLFINCYVVRKHNDICHINWGDDINYYFLGMICSKKIVVKNKSLLYKFIPASNYCCIGSTLGDFIDSRTEIWGSGIISADKIIDRQPFKIHSVRGPLTRDILLKNNIQCPEIYGDPALLLSKVYQPKTHSRYRTGIVLHYVDSNNTIIKDYVHQHRDSVIINMRGYDCWTDVIDLICSCDIILSSSLHGLIVADSYGIPNLWIGLSNNLTGGDFKFYDYFASVSRSETKIQIRNICDIENLDLSDIKNNSSINFESIISSCPFDIQIS